MPRRKPPGWPRYMVGKRLKGGTAFYWDIPTWAKKRGCTLKGEALGTDYAAAKRRCDDLLNPQFDAWRTAGLESPSETRSMVGTFDWLVSAYKTSPRYQERPTKTKKSYDSVLHLVSSFTMRDGSQFGRVDLREIVPGAADRLFARLKVRDDGQDRTRTAVLAMTVCKTAWNVAYRDHPDRVPAANPFAKMRLGYKLKETRAVTLDELLAFVKAADAAGKPSLGTAALIAFFWLQREIDILSRLSWSRYRPVEKPTVVQIFHHKTGTDLDLPLYDHDGTALWPELMDRLDQAERRGTLIVMRDQPDRRRKIHLKWEEDYFRHQVAEIRALAGIDSEVKFMGLRHGGNTEAANAGLTDAQMRALSGHKTAAMVRLYAKSTMDQRRAGARKRLDARTKQGGMSE